MDNNMNNRSATRPDFVPLYFKIEEFIREKIESGVWPANHRVNSERELEELFQASRATIVKAVNNLVRDGILYRIQGKGTFVTRGKYELSLAHFYSFSDDMRRRGIHPGTRVMAKEIAPCTEHLAEVLRLQRSEQVVKLVRVRLANEEPIILETSYLPLSLFPGLLEKDHDRTPLYEILQRDYGARVARAREYFEATLADDWASEQLAVAVGAPLLLFERHAFADGDRAVEFCRGVIRADRYRYYVDLT